MLRRWLGCLRWAELTNPVAICCAIGQMPTLTSISTIMRIIVEMLPKVFTVANDGETDYSSILIPINKKKKTKAHKF